MDGGGLDYLPEADRRLLDDIRGEGWSDDEAWQDRRAAVVRAAAADYFLQVKDKTGKPLDPVARFHLGNGARLERIHWLGDTSSRGVLQSLSVMVNYRYELRDIERNHEAYVNQGTVAASRDVRSLLIAPDRSKAAALTPVEG